MIEHIFGVVVGKVVFSWVVGGGGEWWRIYFGEWWVLAGRGTLL